MKEQISFINICPETAIFKAAIDNFIKKFCGAFFPLTSIMISRKKIK